MAYYHIRVDLEERLTIVTLNRPHAYNALNAAAHEELDQAFDEFQADDDQWIAIITGAGEKAFCAGYDLKQNPARDIKFPKSGFGGLTTRYNLTKPVIAAVNGMAVGGGFEIVLACDIVVAAERAFFALPEPKVGLVALAGGVHRLPREIGLKRAMGLTLTGRRIDSQSAYDLGLVNEVVASDAMAAARAWADEILACSPLAVRATKAAMLRGFDKELDAAMSEAWRYDEVRRVFASEDLSEGATAFVEKRKPAWKGK